MPTWICIRLFSRFLPKGHPWEGRRFTYEEWASSQTALCREFDVAIGVSITTVILAVGMYLLNLRG